MSEPLIRLESVSKSYGSGAEPAVKKLTLEVEKGHGSGSLQREPQRSRPEGNASPMGTNKSLAENLSP